MFDVLLVFVFLISIGIRRLSRKETKKTVELIKLIVHFCFVFFFSHQLKIMNELYGKKEVVLTFWKEEEEEKKSGAFARMRTKKHEDKKDQLCFFILFCFSRTCFIVVLIKV